MISRKTHYHLIQPRAYCLRWIAIRRRLKYNGYRSRGSASVDIMPLVLPQTQPRKFSTGATRETFIYYIVQNCNKRDKQQIILGCCVSAKRRSPNVVFMLAHRLRRWPNIKVTVWVCSLTLQLQETVIQCCVHFGPPSSALAQH